MRRVSVTGYVPVKMKENEILRECCLEDKHIRRDIRGTVLQYKTRSEYEYSGPTKRIRVVVTVDVEEL